MDTRTPRDASDLAGHVHQNVKTIGELVSETERKITRHQRAVEKLTHVIGRPRTLYAVSAGVLAWALINFVMPRLGLARLDEPPFFWLQGVITLAALLTTIMVLTAQNRQLQLAAQRSHLDLQVNLLTEQKVAKVIALIEELRRDLPNVVDRQDHLAERMQEPVDPATVVSALEETLSQAADAAIRSGDEEQDK